MKRVVHYAEAGDFFRISGDSVQWQKSHKGRAFCSMAEQAATDEPITCKRCIRDVAAWRKWNAHALAVGFTMARARVFFGLDPAPAPAAPHEGEK